jgi:hypothetical protein
MESVRTIDYSGRKGVPYRDSTVGEVTMLEDEKGNWYEKREKVTMVKDDSGEEHEKREKLDPLVTMKTEKGRIVVESKGRKDVEGDLSVTTTRRFEPKTEKLDSFRIVDSKADIDIEVVVADEQRWMREFRDKIKDPKVTEAEYNGFMMHKKSWGWLFEKPGEREIRIIIQEDEVWVIDTHFSGSVEKRVDSKTFSLENELLSFDPANIHGAPGKITLKKEEEDANKFLSNSDVKLRLKALKQG